jgi:signal transduction histidine kinase
MPHSTRSSPPSCSLDTDLLATVCHDLRAPLSSIVMGSSFLLKRLAIEPRPSDDELRSTRRMAEAIKRSAERMNAIIDDFHALAHIEAHRVELDVKTYDAEALLQESAEALAPILRAHDTCIEITPASEPLTVLADRGCFLQVTEKIVTNAAQASPAGAPIVVSAEATIDAVVFHVKDAGGGIDPTIVPHLFDYRWLATRRARSGLGLGLGVAKGLVEAQGGALRLESTGAHGTAIAFSLPRA